MRVKLLIQQELAIKKVDFRKKYPVGFLINRYIFVKTCWWLLVHTKENTAVKALVKDKGKSELSTWK